MDRAQLLQHFDTLAETPEAVEKLRKLVLDFAIRGRLVPQNPKDDPATQLVERAKAVLAKERRKNNSRNNGEQAVPPFSLPKDWCWTCLDEIGDTAPKNELDDKTEVGFSPMRLVNAKFGEPISFERKAWSEVRRGFTHFADGDVVVAKITPCFQNGKSGVIRGAPNGFGAGTTELHVLRPIANCVLPEYALVFLKSAHFLINGEAHMTGTAGQKRVAWDYFARTPFPLPPLAEQRRIVAKVEELLALCDELEARQTAAREHRTRLVRSALDHLTTGVRPSPGAATSARMKVSEKSNALRPNHAAAPEDGRTPDDFRRHAAFVLNTFPDLTVAPEDVPALHQAILSLAVQGHIGASDKSDWQGYKLRDLVALITSGSRGWAEYYSDEGPLFVRAQNVGRDGSLLLEDMAHVWLPDKTEGSRTRIKKGDLLVVITGAGVSQATRVKQDFGEAYVSQHVALIRLREPAFAPWLDLHLHAPAGCSGQLQELIYGAKPGLNLENLRELELLVPPLAEQRRIVAEVDELLGWCDALEARLTAARTTATHLLYATLHHLLAA